MKREIYNNVWYKLIDDNKPIFIIGPRQVGKTTFALQLSKNYSESKYLNYDVNGEIIIKDPFFYESVNRKNGEKPLIILDEIHKYSNWKLYIKKIYDRDHDDYNFLITGSGRLDIYQKGGDALIGRYEKTYMFPLTMSEFGKRRTLKNFITDPLKGFDINSSKESRNIINNLLDFSPFPEPFIRSSKAFYKRWENSSLSKIIRQDIRDAANILNIDKMDKLMKLIPESICSTINYSNYSKLLNVSPNTIKKWIETFSSFFILFSIMPYNKISRAIRKDKKYYFFNYTYVKDKGKRFENFVALELHRFVTYWNMLGEGDFDLRYIRNKEREEVDFLLLKDGKPFLMVEAKVGNERVSKSIYKFQRNLNIPAVVIILKENIHKVYKNDLNKILMISADTYLSSLP